jgi:hypothetical protein
LNNFLVLNSCYPLLFEFARGLGAQLGKPWACAAPALFPAPDQSERNREKSNKTAPGCR